MGQTCTEQCVSSFLIIAQLIEQGDGLIIETNGFVVGIYQTSFISRAYEVIRGFLNLRARTEREPTPSV